MITYRPATQADFDFLFSLHKSAMQRYVEETFGAWDDRWQLDYFRKHFALAALRIILYQDQAVGALWVEDRTEELFLVSIEILPPFQRRGIGTTILRQLISQAKQAGKPVALQVLKVNREARDLYQRLGFGVTGENDTHYIMAYEKSRP